MLRVLTLSTLFPNAAQPTFGAFVERQTLGLAAADGVEVEVIAPIALPHWPLSYHSRYRSKARLPFREDWKGLTVHRPRFRVLPGLAAARNGRALADAVLPLARAIRPHFPFDVIDAEFFWPDGVAAMHLSRTLGVPYSVKARGSDIQLWMHRPAVAEQMLQAAHAAGGMLAVSDALGAVMAGFGMPADDITTHYTAVDPGRFHPIDRVAAKRKHGIDGSLIVTVGALIPGKGQRISIATVEQLPEATLLLIGEGPDRKPLEAIIRQRDLGERVRLLGNRPHDEVAELLAAADVMLLPSQSEGLANVWVEALACGTPVVTCDVGGAREVIDRPEAGAIVPADPGAMASAIRALLADPPDQQAVRKAADRFSPEENRRSLRAHLEAIARSGVLSRAA